MLICDCLRQALTDDPARVHEAWEVGAQMMNRVMMTEWNRRPDDDREEAFLGAGSRGGCSCLTSCSSPRQSIGKKSGKRRTNLPLVPVTRVLRARHSVSRLHVLPCGTRLPRLRVRYTR